MSAFEKYPSLEIHTDAYDNNYHVNYVEIIPINRNGYGFERKKIIIDKEKIEKKLEELINIIKK